MGKFDYLKLVIWDLDETFWKGVLSEQSVIIPKENIELINDLVDSGIMVSICSKNNEEDVYNVLKKYKIDELFVFNSINWSSKGERIKEIIKEMNLREANVAFIDDNFSNRGEAKKYCPDLTVYDVDIIQEMCLYFKKSDKKDLAHKRLKQYKVLQEKSDFKSKFASNEEFLKECNIKVVVKKDCLENIERIHELILRSNQLNFTKNRCSIDELKYDLCSDNVHAGYITVSDKFGDYGIVGFYMILDGNVKHFVFSCRTLGMGIEQYTYKLINKPNFKVIGDVASGLSDVDPIWINSGENTKYEDFGITIKKTIIKGPCDMAQTTLYFSGPKIENEFVYVSDSGVVIEQCNHTNVIIDSFKLPNEIKQFMINDLPFMDKDVYKTKIFNNDVDLVVLSLFTDPNLGLYRNKHNNVVIPFGEFSYDLTDEKNWDGYINGKIFNANCKFNKNILNNFKNNYEFIGRNEPQNIISNIKEIFSKMNSKSILCLVLGSETPYLLNKSQAYNDRHIYNQKLNKMVYALIKENKRICALDVNKFINGQESFTNNINHFSRVVYYNMSQELIRIAKNINIEFENDNKLKVFIKKYSRKLSRFSKHPVSVLKGRLNRKRIDINNQ